MKSSRIAATAALILTMAGCGPKAEQPAQNASEPANAGGPAPAAQIPNANEELAAQSAQLPEPKGPIDPKSVEAAGQVVQHYGALIEQNRFGDAAKLWSDAKAAAAFASGLHPWTHLEIGDLGQTEGAAGSIYTTIPVVFYRETFRKPADVILRRVNDVPGSTEAQRRWHIERIEWKGRA
jgi:hypothetical protein